MTATGRPPDFIVLGAAKAGTTSLFRWLDAQPECCLPALKEPRFFSHDEVWRRGVDWYCSLFDSNPGLVTGEASVAYTDPARSKRAADRMVSVVPDARLVYVVRDPLSRARSHYQHQVLKGRESEPFPLAVVRPGNDYVGCSQYHRCLTPFIERFQRSQLCVVRFEDLVADGHKGWSAILRHLGLADRNPPAEAYNASTEKVQFRRRGAQLTARLPGAVLARAPGALRTLGKRALTRSRYAALLEGAAAMEVPEHVLGEMAEDAARLAAWLGAPAPLWPVGANIG